MTTKTTKTAAETYVVRSYDSAEILDGAPAADLVQASLAEEPTGAVPAYCDAVGTWGTWHYVRPDQVEHYRRILRETVVTVYVEEA